VVTGAIAFLVVLTASCDVVFLHGTAWGAVGFSRHTGRTMTARDHSHGKTTRCSSQMRSSLKPVNLKTTCRWFIEALQRWIANLRWPASKDAQF